MTKPEILFEASWEVCNKVGGIYTVIKSKSALMVENYKNNYFLIGPYFKDQAKFEFKIKELPEPLQEVFNELKNQGIICHYGEWTTTKGNPQTILIEFQGLINEKNKIKSDLWDNFKVDSLFSQWDFEEPLLWATAVGKLVELYSNKNNSQIVLHCHEWLAGFALLYLKMNKAKVATIFTTHATMLGRTLSAIGNEIYNNIESINADEEARKNNVIDKHSTEKACAISSDVFTTVSEITSMEAEHFLGKKPDVLLLNGLDIDQFPSFEETSILHQQNREKIREFIAYYFFPYYYFDIEQTLIFFIVGRYEFKNKGIDLFIKSLSKLNNILAEEKSKKTVIAFLWIPTQVESAKQTLAKNKLNYHQIKHFVEQNSKLFQSRLIENILECVGTECLTEEENFHYQVFDENFLQEVRKLRINFAKEGSPPLITHNIPNENNDAIIKSLLENGLNNSKNNKVKIIFYPVYLNGIDGLLDLPYYDAISGCHMGLFPSYYEPWGYTPLESSAWGVPSLTTDLGGFGRFLMSKNKTESGVFVLKRFKRNEDEIIDDFTRIMHNFTKLNRKGRVEEKIIAKEISNLADWKILIENYIKAHELAITKVY
ncbi:glycogen/starch synthase [Candidatus Woesearchaeota archaeon]|nr:glycogen/starch synthase [Candidatus Woesearchaeota archaeon]